MSDTPIVRRIYLLEKFPGKGGWTFARIPEIPQDKHTPFGWVEVSGTIDSYTFQHLKLMPMGNGTLFLPVNAAVRKAINKKAGDEVHIELYLAAEEVLVPEEVQACFTMESPELYDRFCSLTNSQKKGYLDWINSARIEKTRIKRIVKMMENLQNDNLNR